jgi:short-subunit dehydrogenase
LTNHLLKKYGPWALVAGAAEGIGEAYSRTLARAGFNLILVDFNKTGMEDLAKSLQDEFHVQIRTVYVDLMEKEAASICMESNRATNCRLLIYVAAYSRVESFIKLYENELNHFLDLNCRTPLHLVHAFSRYLAGKEINGGILLVSSLAGLIGPRYVSVYAATKSFLIRLAESLYSEMKERKIDIMACAVGTVMTPTYLKSNPDFTRMKPPMTGANQVAENSLNALGKTYLYIPGVFNRLIYVVLQRLMPRSQAKKMVDSAMTKMYGR